MPVVRKWREFRCPVRVIAAAAECHLSTVRSAIKDGSLRQDDLESVSLWVVSRSRYLREQLGRKR